MFDDVHEFHGDLPIYPDPRSRINSLEEEGEMSEKLRGKIPEANFNF